LFGGGGSIAINVNSNKTVYNDINFNVQRLLKYLSDNNPSESAKKIDLTPKSKTR
jgi:site-specific DNA-adenine methylase